jgi:hypothetical protein
MLLIRKKVNTMFLIASLKKIRKVVTGDPAMVEGLARFHIMPSRIASNCLEVINMLDRYNTGKFSSAWREIKSRKTCRIFRCTRLEIL